jgi:hypothetical protein
MSRNKILRSGNVAILPKSRTIFEKTILADSDNPRDTYLDRFTNVNPYVENPIYRGELLLSNGDIVIPDGPDNLFPQRWKMLIEQDSIMPGMNQQKIDLLLSGGLRILVPVKSGSQIVFDEVIDNKISDWLDDMNINDYLSEMVTDWVYLSRVASLVYPNKASQIKSSFFSQKAAIASVIRSPIEDARMTKINPISNKVDKFYVSDWTSWASDAIPYKAFDRKNPFAGVSLFYAMMPSFCSKYYGRPATIGVANYLSLKMLLLNNTKDNIVNAPFRYHIESPLEYWENLKNIKGWSDEDLEAYEAEFLAEIDDVLRSDTGENAMKRIHTKFQISEYGKERLGWKISAIEDESDKRIKSNFDVFEKINQHIIAASNLDPSISNIQIQGKLSSGLDKLTAFNIHILINTPIPRQKILAAVNEAIRINFWDDNYRPVVGFKQLQLSTVSKDVSSPNNNNDGGSEDDDN